MQMILGEIIIPSRLVDNERIIDAKNKGIVKITENKVVNPNKPTLIVGWYNVRSMFDESLISIRKKQINKNLHWTFSPWDEATQDFNEDIEEFINGLYNDFVSNVTYHFIDPIVENFLTSSDIINTYKEEYYFENVYITDNFIYIYDKFKNTINGIDIKYLVFLKFDINFLIINLQTNSCNFIIEDYSEEGTYQKYKQFLNKDFDKKYIPYLLYHQSLQII